MDALLKRHFWIVVALLGSAITWFNASAFTQLLAGKYLPLEPQAFAVHAAPPRFVPPGMGSTGGATTARNVAARSILESNPFDSVTGPIVDAPTLPADPVATTVDDNAGERMFPPCTGAPKLVITVVDPQVPARSFAVLSTGDGAAHKPLAREGSTVGSRQVAVIVREKVYFHEGSSYCFVGMFMPPPPPAPLTPVAPPPGPGPMPGDPGGVPKVSPDILKGIQKVDDLNYNIDRVVVDKIIENQAELMKTARIVPEQVDGKVVGIKLLNIRQDTLLGVLGMQAGDSLKSINGFDMTSPEKALEAYAKLRTAPHIQVGLIRGGKPVNLEYSIK